MDRVWAAYQEKMEQAADEEKKEKSDCFRALFSSLSNSVSSLPFPFSSPSSASPTDSSLLSSLLSYSSIKEDFISLISIEDFLTFLSSFSRSFFAVSSTQQHQLLSLSLLFTHIRKMGLFPSSSLLSDVTQSEWVMSRPLLFQPSVQCVPPPKNTPLHNDIQIENRTLKIEKGNDEKLIHSSFSSFDYCSFLLSSLSSLNSSHGSSYSFLFSSLNSSLELFQMISSTLKKADKQYYSIFLLLQTFRTSSLSFPHVIIKDRRKMCLIGENLFHCIFNQRMLLSKWIFVVNAFLSLSLRLQTIFFSSLSSCQSQVFSFYYNFHI